MNKTVLYILLGLISSCQLKDPDKSSDIHQVQPGDEDKIDTPGWVVYKNQLKRW
ncbi:MAG TPA: hypothetical protein VLJ68_06875 [Chitinophagaceae bacterium]|nr:hypothetical protein [Chitinophagaceae bacterium]